MFKLAGGLYWSLEQALHTDVNYLMLAYAGHVAELNAVFGGGPPPNVGPPKGADGKPITLTASVFDVQFDRPRTLRMKPRTNG